jgi:hypothetical protein
MPRRPKQVGGMEKPRRARRRKPDTAKADLEPPPGLLRRAGCPPRGGIRRACGEVPGRSRGGNARRTGRPMMGQGRARTMGAKALLIHPSHQGVCGRHGTEDLDVTPGDLVRSPKGMGASGPISREVKWEAMPDEKSDDRVVPEARRKPRDRVIGSRVGWGRRSAKVVGASLERG